MVRALDSVKECSDHHIEKTMCAGETVSRSEVKRNEILEDYRDVLLEHVRFEEQRRVSVGNRVKDNRVLGPSVKECSDYR